MEYSLLYDAASGSSAPAQAWGFSGVLAAVAAIWAWWLTSRGHSVHNAVYLVAAASAILAVIGVLSRYEQSTFATRKDRRTVEGVVTGYWSARRNTATQGKYLLWEGFAINGVNFAYAPSVGQNFFHDSGVIRDGQFLRVTYLAEEKGNPIVRVETAKW